MTIKDRIDTAIRPGRPECTPLSITDCYAARKSGNAQHDMNFDVQKADAALEAL